MIPNVNTTENILAKTQRLISSCSKPANLEKVNFTELRLAPQLSQDNVCFTDKSMCPRFLDSLLKIQGSPLEKTIAIKDKICRAMGYKNPELIKVSEDSLGQLSAGLPFDSGKLIISPKMNDISQQEFISCIRHELDHFDIIAKLVKSCGFEATDKALKNGAAKTNLSGAMDKSFWTQIAKDANVENFDAKKYLDALDNYKYGHANYSSPSAYHNDYAKWLYCSNEIEKSAYDIQKRVLKHYKVDDLVFTDVFGDKFGRFESLLLELSKKNSANFDAVLAFNQLLMISAVLKEPGGLKLLKKLALNPQDSKLIAATDKIINKTDKYVTLQDLDKMHDITYDLLKQEKFTLEKIVQQN